MKITFYDRMSILGVLPALSNYKEATVVCSLNEKLRLSDIEINKYGVRQNFETNQVTWKLEANKEEIEIELTKEEIAIIHKWLSDLDKDNKIPCQKEFIEFINRIGWKPN